MFVCLRQREGGVELPTPAAGGGAKKRGRGEEGEPQTEERKRQRGGEEPAAGDRLTPAVLCSTTCLIPPVCALLSMPSLFQGGGGAPGECPGDGERTSAPDGAPQSEGRTSFFFNVSPPLTKL